MPKRAVVELGPSAQASEPEVIDADPSSPAPIVGWDDFIADFVPAWKQGEHVSIVGPTGQGKSVLGLALVKARARARDADTVVFGTKPRDRTLDKLGWPVVTEWPPNYGENQVIVWPAYGDPDDAAIRQEKAFRPVMRRIFKDGNRTVYIDEVSDFHERMGLTNLLNEYWKMGRSNGLTFVAATQRPRGVPRAMFSEPSWLFFFRTPDEDELKRVSEIGGDTKLVKEIVRRLDPHQFLCIRPRTGEMVRSKVIT